MATPAQITANRLNARKSTGPRSVEGKSASRCNALKHGMDAASIVIPGEDPAEYDALAAQYLQEFHPRTASDSFLVDAMLRADWQTRRLHRVEAELHQTALAESPGSSLATVLLAETPAAKLLKRVQRQIAAFERTWHRSNAELRRARKLAEAADAQAFDEYVARFCAMPAPPPRPELASFPQEEQPTSLPAFAPPSAVGECPPDAVGDSH